MIDTADLPEEKKGAIAAIKQGRHGIEMKLHDRVKALELLGKHFGMFDTKDAPQRADNNLFDAIVESAGEVLNTDDLPEIEQAPTAGADLVETPPVPTP